MLSNIIQENKIFMNLLNMMPLDLNSKKINDATGFDSQNGIQKIKNVPEFLLYCISYCIRLEWSETNRERS